MFRLFLTVRNGRIVPFRERYVSRRHAEAGIVAIEEKGGLELFKSDGTAAGVLPLHEIVSFDICRVGSDGCAFPTDTLLKSF